MTSQTNQVLNKIVLFVMKKQLLVSGWKEGIALWELGRMPYLLVQMIFIFSRIVAIKA